VAAGDTAPLWEAAAAPAAVRPRLPAPGGQPAVIAADAAAGPRLLFQEQAAAGGSGPRLPVSGPAGAPAALARAAQEALAATQAAQGGVQPAAQPAHGTPLPAAPVTAAAPVSAGAAADTFQVVAHPGSGEPRRITGTAATFFAGDFGGFGVPGNATVFKLVENPFDGTLYSVGWYTSPASGQLTGFLLDATNNQAVDIKYLSFSSGFSTQARDVAIDSVGNVLVIGNDTAGNGFVMSFTPGLGALNWSATYVLPGLQLNGIADAYDPTQGFNVVAIGGTMQSAPPHNAFVAKLTEWLVPIWTNIYSYPGIDFTGADVGIDPATGNVDLAGSYARQPFAFQIGPFGIPIGGTHYSDPLPGGLFNAVAVDPLGNAYYSGVYYDAILNVDTLLIAQFDGGGANIYSWEWTLSIGGVPENWDAADNAIDGSGQLYVESTIGVGAVTGHFFAEFGPTGGVLVDSGDGGVNGPNNDYGYGIALDPGYAVGANIYLCGATNSPGFAPVTGFETVYNGGPLDGWQATFRQP
jgi:hypothetical protein